MASIPARTTKQAKGPRLSHSRDDINKMQRPAKARDDLDGAYGGNENSKSGGHATHLKARRIGKDSGKTPVKN